MKYSLFFIACCISLFSNAQTSSEKAFTFSAYAELYYSYDFNKPLDNNKPSFVYNHKRHNEVNLNLAYAKASYAKNNIRGNAALMIGNYPQYNLAAEPVWARFAFEANLGVKLSKQHNIWLDAGIMPSHIGFESAVGTDCWTLTRSILAENSPYYETGIKLGYTNKKENLQVSALILNGWQRIRKPDYFQRPGFGVQINYKPVENLTLNYSNFIGSDRPDSLKATRSFHNLYAIYEPNSTIGFIIGFDIGMDKYTTNKYGTWYSPVLITRFQLSPKSKLALRAEYYSDEKEIIVGTGTPNGFKTFGASVNYDYKVNDNVLLRTEIKSYTAKDEIFAAQTGTTGNNTAATLALMIKL